MVNRLKRIFFCFLFFAITPLLPSQNLAIDRLLPAQEIEVTITPSKVQPYTMTESVRKRFEYFEITLPQQKNSLFCLLESVTLKEQGRTSNWIFQQPDTIVRQTGRFPLYVPLQFFFDDKGKIKQILTLKIPGNTVFPSEVIIKAKVNDKHKVLTPYKRNHFYPNSLYLMVLGIILLCGWISQTT
jgi:hypothetical protein